MRKRRRWPFKVGEMWGGNRKLEVTRAGFGYVGLTIMIGVGALGSGNNVIYLVESLLLSGLILSGILSERTVAAVRIEWLRRPAVAGERSSDRLVLHNPKSYPLYCVDIGYLMVDPKTRADHFVSMIFLPRLDAKARITLRSHEVFGRRGQVRWDMLAIATSYPFGFARKLKVIGHSGVRVVWPARAESHLAHASERDESANRAQSSGYEVVEGEIRAMVSSDDIRDVVWTQSRGSSEPALWPEGWSVRPRRKMRDQPPVTLDLRAMGEWDDERFEKAIVRAAAPFHRADDQSAIALFLIDAQGRRKLSGRRTTLDRLAILERGAPE